MEKKIGIIGQGFVGNSIKEGLIKDYPHLLTFDYKKELSNCESLKHLVDKSDYIFICIPTPMNRDGSCFIDYVEKLIQDIYDICSYDQYLVSKVIILKPTIPPGTTLRFQRVYPKFDFIFNPEFLTEANAVNDFKNQNRIILGGEDNNALNEVSDLYKKSFPFVPIVKMTAEEAEMVKYVTNIFLATKVIFANEIYQICESLHINFDNVINASKLDKRLGESHWKVPGPDGDLGFGGSCFYKDINALKFFANENNVDTTLVDAVIDKNNKIRKNKDWEKLKGRAII